MAFIRFDERAERAGDRCIFEQARFGYSIFAGRDERSVFAVSEDVLDILNDRGIDYEILRERDLAAELAPAGYRVYANAREHHPETIYFNALLPPALCVRASVHVESRDVASVEAVLDSHGAFDFQYTEVTQIGISDGTTKAANITRDCISFVIHRGDYPALVEALREAGLAGTSRENKIYLVCDPDGPPRGA